MSSDKTPEQIAEAYLRKAGRKSRTADDTTRKLLLPPPSEPMAVARVFVDQCLHNNSLTLRHWRGGWWMWRTTHWVEVEDREVRGILYRYTEHATYAEGKDPKEWAPTRRKVGDLIDALAAICILPNDLDQPGWLDGSPEDGIIVSVRNGLLNIEQQRLIPHTPQFFNQTSVPFDYDPQAPEPQRWLDFLAALWPNEPNAIDVLAEWFGYVVSGRTDLHKILLMVGPTRGGQGRDCSCSHLAYWS